MEGFERLLPKDQVEDQSDNERNDEERAADGLHDRDGGFSRFAQGHCGTCGD